jgi:5-methylcytosine-specific restriction endonuclease McrA
MSDSQFYEGDGEFNWRRHRNDTDNARFRNGDHAIPKTHPTPGPSPRHHLRQVKELSCLPACVARGRQAPDGAFPNLQRSQAPGRIAIPSDVRREVWRRDSGKCVKCGSREKLEYDHIIPIAKGGSNTARNIELLCEICNRLKSASIQ